MQQQGRNVDRELARLASGSHGLVTRTQLLGVGITPEAIRQRTERGTLIPVHRGVYRVGHLAPNSDVQYMAAVLACGPGARLSGLAAAHLLGLTRTPAPPEVTAPTERRVPGVITHRGAVHPTEATTWRGISTTSSPRTLVDIAAGLPETALARACHEAGVRHHTTPRQVEAVLGRRPTVPGSAKLRRILHGDVHVSLSRLEAVALRNLRTAALPLPATNRPAGTRRVDMRWREHHLTVEVDGYRYHRSRLTWEQDRRREREAYARGDDFRRYTYGDVFEEPVPMLTELRVLLSSP